MTEFLIDHNFENGHIDADGRELCGHVTHSTVTPGKTVTCDIDRPTHAQFMVFNGTPWRVVFE